jgi:hypothetical protein
VDFEVSIVSFSCGKIIQRKGFQYRIKLFAVKEACYSGTSQGTSVILHLKQHLF